MITSRGKQTLPLVLVHTVQYKFDKLYYDTLTFNGRSITDGSVTTEHQKWTNGKTQLPRRKSGMGKSPGDRLKNFKS